MTSRVSAFSAWVRGREALGKATERRLADLVRQESEQVDGKRELGEKEGLQGQKRKASRKASPKRVRDKGLAKW